MPASVTKTMFILSGIVLGGISLGVFSFSVDRAMDETNVAIKEATANIDAVTEVAKASFSQPKQLGWTVKALRVRFDRINYDLASVRSGAAVPRLFVDRLPADLVKVEDVQRKKDDFIRSVLPLILAENDRILDDRKLLLSIRDRKAAGMTLDADDHAVIDELTDLYRVENGSIKKLLKRVDVVPVSLALAQAVEESGWGTSRFAREANAIYGQWTTDASEGIVPERREEGKNHLIRKFDSLSGSVAGYMRNINTHRAYRKLREARAQSRIAGKPLDGYSLAAHLDSYSERGQDYVDGLRMLMRVNKLVHFDKSRLKSDDVALYSSGQSQ